jgi:hypothetical protein|eukprot:COSAG06_NODE_61_length_27084_cov_48.281490_10_plen_51_part_00
MQMEMDALERAPLVSVFVYLEDVTENMAALEAWLGTKTIMFFVCFAPVLY